MAGREQRSLRLPTMSQINTFSWNLIKVVFGLLVFGVLIMGLLNLIDNYNKLKPSLYDKNEYHIVFLNNNLFYFCKIADFNNEYVACNDPYYLVRKKEEKEDGTKEDKIYIRKPEEEEVYQPTGAIFLLKENIVYIAKIGDKSSVMEYINKQ